MKKQKKDNFRKKKIQTNKKVNEKSDKETPAVSDLVRLNKFIANSGLCSRRQADEYIKDGHVKVNDKVVTELGLKVKISDKVTFKDKPVYAEKKVYIVMNKQKDVYTSDKDKSGRKTVVSMIGDRIKERVYPVGTLDRKATGVLLLTNDGELIKKLTDHKYEKKKIYHVFLDKPISKNDLQDLVDGQELDDGFANFTQASFTNDDDKKEVGIEIYSGKNKIVSRMFSHIGYEVEKLDRVFYAGLTKKSLKRGAWRFLSDKETARLKSGSYK